MKNRKRIAILLMLALLCTCLFACGNPGETGQTESPTESTPDTNQGTEPEGTEPEAPVVLPPVDIETTGGVVIVGQIGLDDKGWHMKPEQPLNISFSYFLDKPSVFPEQTRIAMFDPKDDGIEKAAYLGQTVTVAGTFRFFRDDFETLYFVPYTITIGKNVQQSHGDPELRAPEEPTNRYDPSKPLPDAMNLTVQSGKYTYNMYMLSLETLEYMGNDFAAFYVDFVDAFLNYEKEVPCPDERYAELLSTVIYYEFPVFNACAEPFEYFRQYDAEKKTVSIRYKYDAQKHQSMINQFLTAANEMLAGTNPNQTEVEKAKNIYHALSVRMTYDYSALEEFERKESYYAYFYNSGVCVTFANVYNQLLTRVGIKTSVAHCDSTDTIGHSWSIVTLNGKQYFCDPTYELSYDGGSGYRFFGMNYADRTAGGLGAMGIRYGRYYLNPLDPEMIAAQSLPK